MIFNIPTRVYSGQHVVQENAKEWTKWGTNCLIVTGKHSAKLCGALDDVTNGLTKAGCSYEIYDKVEENPTIDNVMEGALLARKKKCDFFVGIGGGSPLDASKAISLMAFNEQEDASFLMKRDIVADYYPVVCIPTTCGTGSEVTPYAIVTLNEQKTKSSIPHMIYPKVALLDARYLESASRTLIVNTACDTLGHAVESIINVNNSLIAETFSVRALQLLSLVKENLLTGEFDDEARKKLLLASMFGGMAIAHTSTTIPHGMSYSLTYELGIPHGRAVGLCLPGFLSRASNDNQKLVLSTLDMCTIDEFSHFIKALLGELALTDDFIDEAAIKIFANKKKLNSCPYQMSIEDIKAIYHN